MKQKYSSRKMSIKFGVLLLVVLVAASDASALQFSVQQPPELAGALKPYGTVGPTPGHPYSMSGDLYAEPFDITMDYDDDGVADWYSRAYCVDFYGINRYDTDYDAMIEPIGNYANIDYVAWLMDSFSTGMDNGFTQPFGEIWEAEVALQLAIWNVVYNLSVDGNTAAFSDTFSFTGPTDNVESLVDQYLLALTGFVATGASPSDSLHFGYAVITPLVDGNYNGQRMVYAVDTTEPVPEPATLVLTGFGLLSLAWRVFRKRIEKNLSRKSIV
ncbi:MAG: PEP-CTERM sorting domain-containing protein [Pseudomonadota bacterium]